MCSLPPTRSEAAVAGGAPSSSRSPSPTSRASPPTRRPRATRRRADCSSATTGSRGRSCAARGTRGQVSRRRPHARLPGAGGGRARLPRAERSGAAATAGRHPRRQGAGDGRRGHRAGREPCGPLTASAKGSELVVSAHVRTRSATCEASPSMARTRAASKASKKRCRCISRRAMNDQSRMKVITPGIDHIAPDRAQPR